MTLSGSDKLLLVHCLSVVAATRLGLTIFSYSTVKRWIPQETGEATASAETLSRIGWAVRNSARLVPKASCLTQALAAQFLLARSGYPSQLRIGVATDPAGRLLAHAWLVSNGRVVVGGSSRELARYALLPDPGAPRP
jgi:hypothetical protein